MWATAGMVSEIQCRYAYKRYHTYHVETHGKELDRISKMEASDATLALRVTLLARATRVKPLSHWLRHPTSNIRVLSDKMKCRKPRGFHTHIPVRHQTFKSRFFLTCSAISPEDVGMAPSRSKVLRGLREIDENITIAIASMVMMRRKRSHRRRWWVHLIHQLRRTRGTFSNLVDELRFDGEIF